MNKKSLATALLVFASTGGTAGAGPYKFTFSGEAVPFTDHDALAGAWVAFSFIIDSEAVPDVGPFGGVAWYISSIQDASLMISGSPDADGSYGAVGPFTMTVADTDAFFEDYVHISQEPDGLFEVPGTNGIGVVIDLWDPFADVLDSTDVPIKISLDDFYDVDYLLASPLGGANLLYTIPMMEMTITPVPEPSSVVCLAIGAAILLRRRRRLT